MNENVELVTPLVQIPYRIERRKEYKSKVVLKLTSIQLGTIRQALKESGYLSLMQDFDHLIEELWQTNSECE